jgi:hypothetical protein
MSKLKTGISLLALFAMTSPGFAADLCNPGASAALKTAVIQQQLMVAGFTCGAMDQYNHFVLAHQAELRKSDAELMAYFRGRDHGREAGYDSYKTKAANLSASRSASEGGRYCDNTAREFAAAEQSRSLRDFVAGEHLLIAAPEACAIKYDMVDVAEAPSYDAGRVQTAAPDRDRDDGYDPPVRRSRQGW